MALQLPQEGYSTVFVLRPWQDRYTFVSLLLTNQKASENSQRYRSLQLCHKVPARKKHATLFPHGDFLDLMELNTGHDSERQSGSEFLPGVQGLPFKWKRSGLSPPGCWSSRSCHSQCHAAGHDPCGHVCTTALNSTPSTADASTAWIHVGKLARIFQTLHPKTSWSKTVVRVIKIKPWQQNVAEMTAHWSTLNLKGIILIQTFTATFGITSAVTHTTCSKALWNYCTLCR